MREPKQLTPLEVMFVGGETPTMYQHTAGLMLLDASDRPDFGFDVFRKHLEDRLAEIPHFRWRLHEVPMGLDLPYWVEDEHFDFDHHVRRIGVASPGDRHALAEVVSHLYARHLDRRRPLWEAWFIEGLEDGQYAFFTKLHHCMMDGEAASKLAQVICDLDPDGSRLEPDPAITGAQAGGRPPQWRQSLTTAVHLWGMPLRASREALDAGVKAARKRLTQPNTSRTTHDVPVASFNTDISGDRGLAFGSLPLDDIKTVKNHFAVTVNDVLLALVGTSMRRFLQERGEHLDASLRAAIAVSLHGHDDGNPLSNQVTTAAVTLATTTDDLVDRLRAINADTEHAKEEAHHGGKSVLEVMSLLPPVLVGAVVSLSPPDAVIRATGINLLVSNVRGSPIPLYISGARVTTIYPMSIIMRGGALNLTCMSYADSIDVGITIEPDVVPDPWLIIDGLGDALDSYLALLPRARRRSKTPEGRPRGEPSRHEA